MKNIQKRCSWVGGTSCRNDNQAAEQKEKQLAYSRILFGLIGAGLWYQLYGFMFNITI